MLYVANISESTNFALFHKILIITKLLYNSFVGKNNPNVHWDINLRIGTKKLLV